MSFDMLLALLLFLGNVALLGVLTYKILKYGELEEDHLNPTDFAKGMNTIFPYEISLQGVLLGLCVVTLFVSPMGLKYFLVLLNSLYFAFLFHLLQSDKWKVDAAVVWGQEFRKKSQRIYLGGLAFCGVCFFLYLYNLVRALTTRPGSKI
eukprot:CAMPEP_0181303592 /NCGR_PEP_ID=MMETSP1101-20121128/8648_1 /TAXON_ID=46948 /ORGANISM="Rhodomonas abbreviata, Strain Caron Lab Isolate" /LENGTH=149 /DNA_ID=CAMNT_0023409191 /DNA_START=221 /DNA_END=670 /DNA_ORIENTATION=+